VPLTLYTLIYYVINYCKGCYKNLQKAQQISCEAKINLVPNLEDNIGIGKFERIRCNQIIGAIIQSLNSLKLRKIYSHIN
jgi:hypothetical protein